MLTSSHEPARNHPSLDGTTAGSPVGIGPAEIVAGVTVEETKAVEIAEAVRGIEDVLTGKVRGLSEVEFRAALK